jgi:hypothetical protein
MVDVDKLDFTLGAVEVGTFVSAILYGMVLVQGHMYSMASRTDQLWVKVLVLFVMLLETVHMVSMISYVYYVTVTHVDSVEMLMAVKWFTVINITFASLVGTPVQAYFTWRAWSVSKHAWYATPPWFAELVRLGIVLANCVYLANSDTVAQYKITRANLITSTLTMCLLVDLWNSAVLCYHLKLQRSTYERFSIRSSTHNPTLGDHSSRASTVNYVNSIIIWSIETSLVMCLLAVVSLGFWLCMPSNSIWLCVLMVHARIYSNSMMLSLNARILRKAAMGRPALSLNRTWDITQIQSPGRPLSSSTQPDSAVILTPSDCSPQYAYVNYNSKFSVPSNTSSRTFTPSLVFAAGYGDLQLPKLAEDA